MEPLPLIPLDRCTSASLLHHVQVSAHRHHGLLLVQPSGEGELALAALKERWAAVNHYAPFTEVPPHEEPAGAALLHKLGRRLTKAHMSRLGEHPYRLHPYLDDPSDWMHPTQASGQRVNSKIIVSRSAALAEHIDRGLFNVVLGTPAELADIQVDLAGEQVGVKALLPDGVAPDRLLGLVIPGFTLQCIDPHTPAIPHSVFGDLTRGTLVLQWRLNPGMPFGEGTLGDLLAQIRESVRGQQGQPASDASPPDFRSVHGSEGGHDVDPARPVVVNEFAERMLQAGEEPTIAAARKYNVTVKTLTGKTFVVPCHPQWTTGNLAWAIQQREGVRPSQQLLVFEGKHLAPEATLNDSQVPSGATLHLVLSIRGD